MGVSRPILLYVVIFMLGWTASVLYLQFNYSEGENPAILGSFLSIDSPEMISPQNHLGEDKIHVYEDRIILDLADASWSTYADTNSMDPIIDINANGIEIRPQSIRDVGVGDIISFRKQGINGLVVHRVVEIGTDSNGWYVITKGDNNPTQDPGKVRFEDIHGVVVGVIY